jgi:hypothetical protein
VIILSGVLVILAIALLVTGIVTGNTGHEVAGLDGLKLIYVSIGVSIISALCLAIGVFLRRKELFGTAESEATAKRSTASRSAKAARTARAKARVGAGGDPITVTPAAAAEVPAETSVFIVPGRKRYHLETCRQLAGRDKEELTFIEAREEGFTACTACLPDTALAARASLAETAPAGTAPTESPDTLTAPTYLASPDDDPALATRTDLPVTRLDTDLDTDAGTGSGKDTGLDTREIEPAAESPAAADLTEAPESDLNTDAPAEPEAASTSTPTERPLARSRSLFEPLGRDDASMAEDATDDEDLTDRPAPSEPEDADEDTTADRPADAEPEDAEPESPAGSAVAPDATKTPAADHEAADEPTDEAEQDGGTPEPSATTAAGEDTPSADEATDEADREDAGADAGEHPDLPFVRILSGTKRYHRPDCALIEDIAEDADDLETLSPAEARERGCTPCLVCQPDKDPSDD